MGSSPFQTARASVRITPCAHGTPSGHATGDTSALRHSQTIVIQLTPLWLGVVVRHQALSIHRLFDEGKINGCCPTHP
jgi:hypothetical protein